MPIGWAQIIFRSAALNDVPDESRCDRSERPIKPIASTINENAYQGLLSSSEVNDWQS